MDCNRIYFRQKVVDFLDLTLLKDLVYLNIVLGLSFALYSDNSFFILEPMYLFELTFSKVYGLLGLSLLEKMVLHSPDSTQFQADTAMIVAIGAAADMSSRMFLAVMSLCVQVRARYVYLSGAVGTIFFRFGEYKTENNVFQVRVLCHSLFSVFLYIHDFIPMAIITAIMGFLRTWLHVPLALVFGEYLPQERFSSGYGLFMFIQGNFAFIIGPFIGWIRDFTQR